MDDSIRALERSASQGDAAAKDKLERLRARAGLHEASATVFAAHEALVDAQRAALRAFRDEGLADFQRFVEAVFAREPGLHAALIRGYTPSFLDGDLCEHSQSVSLRDLGEDVPGAPENVLTDEAARALERGLDAFEPVLHARYHTDWQLTLRRGPAGVEVTHAPYSSGY